MVLLIFATLAMFGLSLPIQAQAQAKDLCPPAEILSPCICFLEGEINKTASISCGFIQNEFNLKEVFDNASKYVEDEFVFHQLLISHIPSLVEIGEGVIQQLKFEEISIFFNPNLEYVSPRAFNATREWTYRLAFFNNSIRNFGGRERDIFDVANGFKKLRTLNLQDNRISSIPDHALQNMSSLGYLSVHMERNPISYIGSWAFAVSGSSDTLVVLMDHNSIPSGGLAEDAFDGMKTGRQIVSFSLSCNNIEYMEQGSFRSLLDQADYVDVGSDKPCHEGDADVPRYYCDERVGWICDKKDNYRWKLSGYRCKNETDFGDIWEYCAERNITITTIPVSF